MKRLTVIKYRSDHIEIKIYYNWFTPTIRRVPLPPRPKREGLEGNTLLGRLKSLRFKWNRRKLMKEL